MAAPAERLSAALAERYRLGRALGAGGMAAVYLAADLKHDRKVAIKVLKPELAAVLGAERFVQEIKTTAPLSHPHILPLFDSGEAGGFLVAGQAVSLYRARVDATRDPPLIRNEQMLADPRFNDTPGWSFALTRRRGALRPVAVGEPRLPCPPGTRVGGADEARGGRGEPMTARVRTSSVLAHARCRRSDAPPRHSAFQRSGPRVSGRARERPRR